MLNWYSAKPVPTAAPLRPIQPLLGQAWDVRSSRTLQCSVLVQLIAPRELSDPGIGAIQSSLNAQDAVRGTGACVSKP